MRTGGSFRACPPRNRLRNLRAGLRPSPDGARRTKGHPSLNMTSYPVLWRELDDDGVYAGRLEFDAYGFALHGGAGGRHRREYVCDCDLEQVSRDYRSRIGPCRALQLATRDGRSLPLATLTGDGPPGEVAEALL